MVNKPSDNKPPDRDLTRALEALPAGRALDVACGSGRHARWLAARGWNVTAVDLAFATVPGVAVIQADLETDAFAIQPAAWDLIVCWLYWQASLLAPIAAGVRPGGVVALAGKISGRFATSLAAYKAAFGEWEELISGEDGHRVFLVARKPTSAKR